MLSIASIACVSQTTLALSGPRMMMHPELDLYIANSPPLQTKPSYVPTDVTLAQSEFAEMRSMGADIELIKSHESDTPSLSMSEFTYTQTVDPGTIDGVFDFRDHTLTNDDTMRFYVGRNTTLNDGNISGSEGSLPGLGESVSTMTQSEGEYNFYDMAVEWQAASSGDVDFSFTSGVTAIQANISKRVTNGGSTDLYDATNKVIAVPTIGSSVRWKISNDWSLTGSATTQSVNVGSSLLGFQAQSDWRISDRVGLSAGYQILRSQFDLGAVTSDLNQEGLFARLQIRF
tara:strand:+ start:42748 stop:43611 length:864 start_codon:yes stop_codon:yes gene_type:complete